MNASPVEIPDWLRALNPNSLLSVKDMCSIWNCHSETLRYRERTGTVPPRDYVSSRGGGRRGSVYWKVSTVLKWLRTQ